MLTRSRSKKKQSVPVQAYEPCCQNTTEHPSSASGTGSEYQCETGEREMVLVNVWSTGSRTPSCDTQNQHGFSEGLDPNSGHETDSQVSQDEQRGEYLPPRRKGRKRRFVIPEDDEQELLRRTSSAEPHEEKPGQPRKAKTLQDKTRERNRIAAQQCRWRLKKYVERLENAKGSQETLNAQLVDECSRLEREQAGLRNEENNAWQYLFEQVLPLLRNRLNGEDLQALGALHTLLETPAPDVQMLKQECFPGYDGSQQGSEQSGHEDGNTFGDEIPGDGQMQQQVSGVSCDTNPLSFTEPCTKAEVPCFDGGPQGHDAVEAAMEAYDALIAQCEPVLTFEDVVPEPPQSPLVACAIASDCGDANGQTNIENAESTGGYYVPQG